MKKILLLLAVAIIGTAANAQLFVGGSFGIDKSYVDIKSGSITSDDGSALVFQIVPKVGYYLNEDFAIGVSSGIIKSIVYTPEYGWGYPEQEKVETLSIWAYSVFARYNLVRYERFSLLLNSELGGGKITSKTKIGSTTTEDNPTSIFAFAVMPILSFDITERFSLEMSSDFLRLGFTSYTETDLDDKDYNKTTNNFGLGVNAFNNQLQTPLVNLGIIVKF